MSASSILRELLREARALAEVSAGHEREEAYAIYAVACFLLHTKAYQDCCERMLGKFVHHQPGFLDREEHGGGKALRARTVDAIASAGFVVDMDFWPDLDIADCSQCHANCHNSPKHNAARLV